MCNISGCKPGCNKQIYSQASMKPWKTAGTLYLRRNTIRFYCCCNQPARAAPHRQGNIINGQTKANSLVETQNAHYITRIRTQSQSIHNMIAIVGARLQFTTRSTRQTYVRLIIASCLKQSLERSGCKFGRAKYCCLSAKVYFKSPSANPQPEPGQSQLWQVHCKCGPDIVWGQQPWRLVSLCQ